MECGKVETKNEEEILARRKRLNANPQSALLGPHNVSEYEAGSIGEIEFMNNVGYYGECNEFAFNDIMVECIECWSDVESTTFYPAFAWTLFSAIVHVHEKIPTFIEQRKIKRIPTGNTMEAEITKAYHADKAVRENMTKIVKWAKENSHINVEATKRMQSRRQGRAYASQHSKDLYDLCTIHMHSLDREAADIAAKSKGRISPNVRSQKSLKRAMSLKRSESIVSLEDFAEEGSTADEEESDSSFMHNNNSASFSNIEVKSSAQESKPQQLGVFKRSKSTRLMIDTQTGDIDSKEATHTPHSYVSSTSSKNLFIEEMRSEIAASMSVTAPPQVENYPSGNSMAPPSRVGAPIPQRKKREILVKKNSTVANKMKLDPQELDPHELEYLEDKNRGSSPLPFDVGGTNDDADDICSVLSRQSSVLSRQNSAARGGLSRQSSGVLSSPTHSQHSHHSRPPLSRATSAVKSIQFEEDEKERVKESREKENHFEQQDNNTVSTISTEKTLPVNVRHIRPIETDTMTDTETVEESNFSSAADAIRSPKYQQKTKVENVLPGRRGSLVKPMLVEYLIRSQSQSPRDFDALENSNASGGGRCNSAGGAGISGNADADGADEIKGKTGDGTTSNDPRFSGNRWDNSMNPLLPPHNEADYSEGCHDDDSNADYISNLEMEGYQDLHDDDMSAQHSAQSSLETPLDLVTGELSIGPSLDPGSLSKYNHHIEQSSQFKDSISQYIAELPENAAALPLRLPQRRKARVSVTVTPKMALAKEIIEQKKLARKKIQGKAYLQEKRKLDSYVQKRGQTPMQRNISSASNTFIPSATGRQATPAEDLALNNDHSNIEYLMTMVARNARVKMAMRKTGLGSIALDMGRLRLEQEDSFRTFDDSIVSSPESHTGSGGAARAAAKSGTGGKGCDTDSVHSHASSASLSYQCEELDADQAEEKNTIKVLDLFNMKKGLIRCSYLNLLNTDGLPEFIYISKQGPYSMAERISNGSAEVTEWERYLITFVHVMDTHISSSISKGDQYRKTLKSLMSELLSLQSVCSKEQRYRRLSIEFGVPSIGDRVDELHILGEIYRIREQLIRRVMKETAAILQKDIEVKRGPLLFDSLSVGSSKQKFPAIDDSHSLGDSASSVGGSRCSTNRKAVKSRKKWVKKMCASARHNAGLSVASGTSSTSAHSATKVVKKVPLPHSHMDARSMNDSDNNSVGNNSVGNNSVMSEISSNFVKMRPIVNGSVTMSTQGDHSSVAHSYALSQSQSQSQLQQPRSQSATTRLRRHKNSLPLMPNPTDKQQQHPFMTGNNSFASSEDSQLLTATKLHTHSTLSRPHTASFSLLNTLSFYPESTANCDDAIYFHNDSPYIPWVPSGGMKLMVSDKTDVLNGWRERRDIGPYVETTRNSSVRKRTEVVRDSFESFTRNNPDFGLALGSKSMDFPKQQQQPH